MLFVGKDYMVYKQIAGEILPRRDTFEYTIYSVMV
jgi:hypothetical protein